MPKTKAKFTVKQQRFINYYNGNATDAARKAGYKNPRMSGHENLTKPNILEAIQSREQENQSSAIMSRRERQEFWTKMARMAERDTDKLKASELLGRSQADFTDNHNLGLTKQMAEKILSVLPPEYSKAVKEALIK